MKVKLLTLYAGRDGVKNIGDTADFDTAKALDLVTNGYAEYVEVPVIESEPIEVVKIDAETEIETASFKPVENAMKPRPQIKKKGGK